MHPPARPKSLGPAMTEPDDAPIWISRKVFEEILEEIDALVVAETKLHEAFVAFGKERFAVDRARALAAFGKAMSEFAGHRVELLRMKRCLRESDPTLDLTPVARMIGSRTDVKAAFDQTSEFAEHSAPASRVKPTS